MRIESVGRDRPEKVFLAIRNGEATVDIPRGSTVCFVLNGNNDGNDVVLTTTGGALKSTYLFAGVVVDPLPNQQFGYAQVFGYCQGANLVQRTRGASTDDWGAVASIAAGIPLVLDINTRSDGDLQYGGDTYAVINNGFTIADAIPNDPARFYAILASSQAALASSASSSDNSSTAQISRVPVFLRAM